MRILWILPYLPWPTTSGGKTRQYHLLRELAAQGHRITLLVQAKTALDDDARAALQPLLEQLIVLPRRSLRDPRTLAAALFGPWPLLTCVNGMAPALEQRFAALLQESWDIIQVEHSYSLQPYLPALQQRQQPFLLTEHNLESSLGGATYNRFPAWLSPFVRYDQWRARRWERRVFERATRVIAVTDDDARAMRQLTATPVDVVVNGVDCEHFATVQATAQSQRILFVGNYEYPPNVDAMTWALDEIFPRLWQQCPEARLAVAGYALPEHWRTRWPDPRIEWHGFVADLRQLQRSCAVFLAPLRQGGGSKLKVLEALAAGLPLVSTAQGVSGLSLTDGDDYLAGEQTAALASQLAELLDNPAKAQHLARNGRAYVQRSHDWQAAAQQLQQVYHQLQPSESNAACA